MSKLSTNGDVKSNGRATSEDENEDEDVEAGPEMPPDDDEDGRFFGGGITNNTREVLDFMEEQDKDEPVNMLVIYVQFCASTDAVKRIPRKLILLGYGNWH